MPKAWFSNQTLAERLFQGSIRTTKSLNRLCRFQHRAQLRSLRKTPGRTIQRHRPSFTSCLICWTLPGFREDGRSCRPNRLSTRVRPLSHARPVVGPGSPPSDEYRMADMVSDGKSDASPGRWARFAIGISARAASPAARAPFKSRAPLPDDPLVDVRQQVRPFPKNKNPAIRGGVQSGEERAFRRAVEPSDQAGMRSSMSCGSRST